MTGYTWKSSVFFQTVESFLQTSSELEGQYVKNTRAEWPWGDLDFWGSSESILGLQAAQLLPFRSSMTLWLLHSHFLVTKYLCGQRTRQWFFPLTVYWKKHTPCSLISDEKKIKKQTGEVTGTLPKKRQKDENYQGYIWLVMKTLTEPNFISFHSSAL